MLQVPRRAKTRAELWILVYVLFGVAIPRTKVCVDHCSPFDAFADAYFGVCTIGNGEPYEISQVIWHASRGLAGKSKTLSILGLLFAYIDGADITILGGSMAQSTNVHEYMVKGMDSPSLPIDMVVDETATKIQLTNKGRVRPLPASQRNVRGPHPSVLLMDEVDEMDLDIYDAALGQPMPQPNWMGEVINTMTVVSSTWQNADGTLTEIFRREEDDEAINEDGDRRTPIYRWCYHENLAQNNPPGEGWLTDRTVEEKRHSVSAEMFRIEYDLGEPSIGNRAFDTEKVKEVWCLDVKPIWEKHVKDWDEWRFAKPEVNATYAAGADWAKEQDKTVISVVRTDRLTRELVYTARVNRTTYLRMVGLLNREMNYYGVGLNGAWHDSTGLGNVVNDLVDQNARPFHMGGIPRTTLLSDFVLSIEKVTWKLPKMLKAYYLEMERCSTGDLYSTKQEFHLPDTVCSLALAEYGAKRVVNAAAPIVLKGDGTPSKAEAQFLHPADQLRSLVSGEPSIGEINLVV